MKTKVVKPKKSHEPAVTPAKRRQLRMELRLLALKIRRMGDQARPNLSTRELRKSCRELDRLMRREEALMLNLGVYTHANEAR
jgi:hypothetical protein